MKDEFKIGDKVMVNFGQYGNNNYRIDEIIGQTKTLWKCRSFSFSKVSGLLRNQSEWHHVFAEHYNEKLIEEIEKNSEIRDAFSKAEKKLYFIGNNYAKMQSFIDWAEKNL